MSLFHKAPEPTFSVIICVIMTEKASAGSQNELMVDTSLVLIVSVCFLHFLDAVE